MDKDSKKITTFAQEAILKGAEKKKNNKSKFQDNNCRFDETYTQQDPDDGHSYTVHDQGVGY
ncbi:MAG: hypothetical protein J6T81_02450 [Bacteroidales bacterium]|nr:hypothetical protein [Bacteroidales bacterium]